MDDNRSVRCKKIVNSVVCGYILKIDSKFCPNCGGKIDESLFKDSSQPTPSTYICKSVDPDGNPCQKEVLSTDKFCSGCGSKNTESDESSFQNQGGASVHEENMNVEPTIPGDAHESVGDVDGVVEKKPKLMKSALQENEIPAERQPQASDVPGNEISPSDSNIKDMEMSEDEDTKNNTDGRKSVSSEETGSALSHSCEKGVSQKNDGDVVETSEVTDKKNKLEENEKSVKSGESNNEEKEVDATKSDKDQLYSRTSGRRRAKNVPVETENIPQTKDNSGSKKEGEGKQVSTKEGAKKGKNEGEGREEEKKKTNVVEQDKASTKAQKNSQTTDNRKQSEASQPAQSSNSKVADVAEQNKASSKVQKNEKTTHEIKQSEASQSVESSNSGASKQKTDEEYLDEKSRSDFKVLLPKDQRERQTNAANKGGRKSKVQKITVHFYVIVPTEEMKFNEGEDKVIMKFENYKLGGWSSNEWIMKIEKKINEKNILMKCEMAIEKDCLLGYHDFEYKYAILSKGKCVWEFVHKKTTEGISANRVLSLTYDQIQNSSEWQQYDGIMSKEPDKATVRSYFVNKWTKWTGSYYDQIMKKTQMAAMAMLPSWNDLNKKIPTQNFLQTVDQVCYCSKKFFVNEEINPDESKMIEVLSEYIQPVIKRIEELLVNASNKSPEESGIRLALGCCLVYIIQNYKLEFDRSTSKLIFQALLLRFDDTAQKCHDYQQLVEFHLPNSEWQRKISEALLKFICRMSQQTFVEPLWLFAVPLLHFIGNVIKPLAFPRTDHPHTSDAFWGITDLKKLVTDFKHRYMLIMPLNDYLDGLGPLFSYDMLMPRTLLSVMSLNNIPFLIDSKLIPPDACLANLIYFIRTEKDLAALTVPLERMNLLAHSWLNYLPESSFLQQLNLRRSEVELQYKIAVEMLKEICSRTVSFYSRANVVIAISIVANVLSNMRMLLEIAKETIDEQQMKSTQQEINRFYSEFVDRVDGWVHLRQSSVIAERKYYDYHSQSIHLDVEEFKMFGDLLDINYSDADMANLWKQHLEKLLIKRLKMLTIMDQIRVSCSEETKQFTRTIEDILDKIALEVLEDSANCKQGDFSFIFDVANKGEMTFKIQKLLEKMYQKAWPVKSDGDNFIVLQHILTWPSFNGFIHLIYSPKLEGLLSDNCVGSITIAISIFHQVIDEVQSGKISTKFLKLLVDEKSRFLELFKIMESGMKNVPDPGIKGFNKADVVLKVLSWRQTEVKAFEEECELLRNFIKICSSFDSVDIERLKQSLKSISDETTIEQLCEPMVYSVEHANIGNYRPKIHYFPADLLQGTVPMLNSLWKMQASVVYKDIWKSTAERAPNKARIVEILNEIWRPTEGQWNQICQKMSSGDITLDRIDKLFKKFERRYDVIQKEVELMCKERAHDRVKQIKQYHQLGQYCDGADMMIKLRDKFELEGDFTDAKNLSGLVKNKTHPLKSITDELISFGNQLIDINQDKVDCLYVFLRNKPLVDWLRTSVSSPKEVKVLVDLAMISAEGQGDMEVTKVSCLYAAAIGYAPLIYDLKTNMGFREFLPLCQAVWRSLEVDKSLPTKFNDTGRLMDWLNRIKESHGSVELSALASAKAINAKGIYTVGSLTENNKVSLDQVVRLKLRMEKDEYDIEKETNISIREKLEKEKWQTLGVSQLNDLQSKLMLVAGKAQEGKQDVDTFVEIFDGITRLGNLYIRICKAGCTLFQNWKAIFYCNPEKRRKCVHVVFGNDGNHKLFGDKSEVETGIVGHILTMCDFLEDCLKEWLQHIEVQRMNSYYLNHYTTEQLVILQNELAKINTPEISSIANTVFPMLSFVKHNCTLKDLQESMGSAFELLMAREVSSTRKEQTAEQQESMDDDEAVINSGDGSQVDHFLETLQESGFSKKLAIAALKSVGPDSIDEGILWCMKQDDDDDDDEDEKEDEEMEEGTDVDGAAEVEEVPRRVIAFPGLHLEKTKDTMTADLFESFAGSHLSTLKTHLFELWTLFEKEMNTSIADYLSIEHLGFMLESLAQKDSRRYNRLLPSFMTMGKPNLVVCSQAEILSLLLSIYMNDSGVHLPLPSVDEVLICNQNTTAEDVDLLWQRAAGDARGKRYGKIYSLVHAELLDYDVARHAEQSLEKHVHEVNNIQIVVLCCREQEDRSFIINALDRFRVRVPPVDMGEVQNYLKQHFSHFDDARTRARSAASLDVEGCCVRVIKSHRAGVGKTLKVQRLLQQLENRKLSPPNNQARLLINIPLHSRNVDQSAVLKILLAHTLQPQMIVPRIFHIDIAHEVTTGVDYLLFNLLVLGSITDREGYVWQRLPSDLYIIETMPLMQRESKSQDKRHQTLQYVHHILHLLPAMTCWSPKDSLELMQGNKNNVENRYENVVVTKFDQMMDEDEFRSSMFQRPYQYLQRFMTNQELRGIHADTPQGNPLDCIQMLLRTCGVGDPSWSELRHFANFFNVQLQACERSVFCSDFLAPDLPGFLNFVVKFMMQMSKDFATRSLTISEETPEVQEQLLNLNDNGEEADDDILGHYSLKRRWETSPHPYLFFNADQQSFTFMGFIINPNGDILEPGTNRTLATQVLQRPLYDALARNRVNLQENFDALPRDEKITKMCNIMGIEFAHDPDDSYELTADNVKKMLAIYMRFRCDIPVIVMGETGCGKTRLIKFISDLWKPPGSDIRNMILMKVHGGITAEDIVKKVREAEDLALRNGSEFPDTQTVLFFDEANTTDAIGMIKEIMCDQTLQGTVLPGMKRLKLIAACNPYRKHSAKMINRLEHAGLGYHVQASQTTDKLGRIPMRQLVYRVQSLPQSMLPLVWDFGQLSTEVETLYIRQMVHRYIRGHEELLRVPRLEDQVSIVLAQSQAFMRMKEDECSFVSLRDVDRALNVLMWFYHRQELFDEMDKRIQIRREEMLAAEEDIEDIEVPNNLVTSLILALCFCYHACLNGLMWLYHRSKLGILMTRKKTREEVLPEIEEILVPDNFTRSLILALGICYHACLEKREKYRDYIAPFFLNPLSLSNGADTILEDISCCQEVFLDAVDLGENIARNQALKENVFMMVICIELRILLFLVGKPGSSKSLAKTIVADAMQGEAAKSEIFRSLKSVHMVSYQCSPLSTPEGIVGIFRQCAELQKSQDLNKFVSVVVLDEVGLAEDSEKMPLKTLHPLLEDGCEGDENPLPHKKVGFIGISNWALDPAKMNRGILVQRGVPDEQELEQSAKGICASDEAVASCIECLVKPLSKGYLKLYKSALTIREFFGLRDFYSLIKMVYGFAKKSGRLPTWHQLQHAILRNFGGLDDVNPVENFASELNAVIKMRERPKNSDPNCDPATLIQASLAGDGLDSESRYLLILTENYAALGLLQHKLLKLRDAIIIFGSSFPKDQEYTQVCRNINRIKVCMETGRTVVLLNLENLYESLYDALNQYYVKFGDQRFVDLGLGTQRVKCRVHQQFRLIVVAEKRIVYEKFPIPLINRLEKHFLAMSTILTRDQIEIADRLRTWAENLAASGEATGYGPRGLARSQPKVEDVFIGYHADTAASIVLQVSELVDDYQKLNAEHAFEIGKNLLLQCAVPDAIMRLPDSESNKQIQNIYFKEQHHDNIADFVRHLVIPDQQNQSIFVQITTHSRLLLPAEAKTIATEMEVESQDIWVQPLHAFNTEQQFCRMLKDFFNENQARTRILLLQCDSGDVHADLIACARYNILNEFNQALSGDNSFQSLIYILFIVQLPKIAGGCFIGFQGGKWISYHIDELLPNADYFQNVHNVTALKGRSMSSIFESVSKNSELNVVESMETEHDDDDDDEKAEKNRDEQEMEVEDERETDAMEHGDDNQLEAVMQTRKKKVCEMIREVQDAVKKGDIDAIIRNCLIGATAMLKDSGKDATLKQRKTRRLHLLQKFVEDIQETDMELQLIDLLRDRVTLLLKDKENTAMHSTMVSNWLSKEAASFENVCRNGTFRRSLKNLFESRVTPLLAYIVGFCDKNANLDLLDDEEYWVKSMWLAMFNDPEITAIKYSDLQTATMRAELEEFEVKSTGYHGTFFKSLLPFSWLIKNHVDQLIFASKQAGSVDEDTETRVERLFLESSYGRILSRAFQAGGGDSVMTRYLSDYVSMVFGSQSKTSVLEHQLIVEDLGHAVRHHHRQEISLVNDEDDDSPRVVDLHEITIPSIHFTFNSIQRRYRLFSEVVQVHPECVEMLSDGNKAINLPLDFKLLILLLENLASKKINNELDNINTRRDWINRVRTFGPHVLRLMESVGSIPGVDFKHLEQYRCTWNRVYALQLFIEHVRSPDSEADRLSVKKCMPLWNTLGETADFKTGKSLKSVEDFLKICNQNASDAYFGKKEKCNMCDNQVKFPVELPCKHVVCMSCLVESKELEMFECRECFKKFSKDFQPEVIKSKKEAVEKYNRYKQRCNGFFMDLVSHLCFSGDTPPDADVIHKLMAYVTPKSKLAEKMGRNEAKTRTKKLALLEESIDPTPVVRSFLLQLLLRSDVTVSQVHEYLEQYFASAQKIIQSNPEQIVELCVLCIQCFEDYYHREALKEINLESRLSYVQRVLLGARNRLFTVGPPDVNKLISIAMVRHGLVELADALYHLCVTKDVSKTVAAETRNLCEAGRHICEQNIKWPRIYLMKQVVRRFGMDALKQMSREPCSRWIIPNEAKQNEIDSRPDRFVVCGENYKGVREALTQTVLGKNFDLLQEKLNDMKGNEEVNECEILLALYREVTSAFAHREDHRIPKPETLEQLTEFFQKIKIIKLKELINQIIRNQIGGNLVVTPNQNEIHRGIAEVVVHFSIALQSKNNNDLNLPFIQLMRNSNNMQTSFLPTMPQDDFVDITTAVVAATAMYRCANGHYYFVGDCGQLNQAGRCPCGQPIGGGSNGQRITNNAVADQTLPGHILGQPQPRPPTAERTMSSTQTSILRMMLHMSMYLGSLSNPQNIANIIRPPIAPDQVGRFLWNHITFDLDSIHTAIARSHDDVLLMMHLLIDQMIRNPVKGDGTPGNLGTKQARQLWETNYVNSYISPVLQGLNKTLQDANNDIVNDDRLGSNPLLKTLYELDTSATVPHINEVHNVAAVWRYRSRVSVEHLAVELQDCAVKKEKSKGPNKLQHPFPVLQLFLTEERQLRALGLLPNILKLHRHLLSRFNRCIDKSDATTTTIRTFLDKDDHMRRELQSLIEDFFMAWECIRHSLRNFTFGKGIFLTCPVEYTRKSLTEDDWLAVLLPYPREWGLCSVMMVYYLISKQNDFLENFSKEKKQSLQQEHVDLNSASYSHLVAYHPERDLQPIILANCNYSLEVGKGTEIEYDFASMEKQITERFVQGRPRLTYQMEFILFREDFTNASVFMQLRLKIPQVPLNDQTEIVSDLKQKLPEIGDLLASLNIAVEFLVSVPGDPELSVVKFMSDTLKMKTRVECSSIHKCKLKHVESLWLLLSFLKAKMQANYKQDPFDNIDAKYHAFIPMNVQKKLRLALQHINVEVFLPLLYECIIFKMTLKNNSEPGEEENDNSQQPLKDHLLEYINEKDTLDSIPALEDNRFPDDLLVAHCISTWLLALLPKEKHPVPPADQ